MDRETPMCAISLDEWEVLPDHKSFFMEANSGRGRGHGHDTIGDEETKKLLLPSPEDVNMHEPVEEFKDIGVVEPLQLGTESTQEESILKVNELFVSHGEEDEKMIKSPGTKKVNEDKVVVEVDADQRGEEEDVKKERTGLDCVGFSVGRLRVNGIGALCSLGFAAATVCVFLLGGRVQQQQKQQQQNQKIQSFQMCADDKRIQQVVQQASRLNQAVSSVMGGTSPRATISFGGYYFDEGF